MNHGSMLVSQRLEPPLTVRRHFAPATLGRRSYPIFSAWWQCFGKQRRLCDRVDTVAGRHRLIPNTVLQLGWQIRSRRAVTLHRFEALTVADGDRLPIPCAFLARRDAFDAVPPWPASWLRCPHVPLDQCVRHLLH